MKLAIPYVEFNGSLEDCQAFAKQLNEARRHLPKGKRALSAAKEATATVGKPKNDIASNEAIIQPNGTEEVTSTNYDVLKKTRKTTEKSGCRSQRQ